MVRDTHDGSRKPNAAIWRVDVIGCFRLSTLEDRRSFTPTSRKACALLAYLDAREGHRVSRERLCGLLWCESPEQQARASLRQVLHDIKRRCAPLEPPFEADRQHVWLASDLVRRPSIEELCAREAGDWLPYEDLDGVSHAFDDWLSVERRRITESILALAMKEVAVRLEEGRSDGLLEAVRRLQRIDPLNEDFVRMAMLVEHRAGHAISIRRHFMEYAERAERELGVSPARETSQLEHRLIDALTLPREPRARGD